MSNKEIMLNINSYLGHLSEKQRLSSIKVIHSELFADHPAVTNAIIHDIDVEWAALIRSHSFGVNAGKIAIIKREVDYTIRQGIVSAAHSVSVWTSEKSAM